MPIDGAGKATQGIWRGTWNAWSDVMRADVTIYFIRHGQTDWNAESRYQGQADVPMNERGRAQARRNGEVLHPLMPALGSADFVGSPLCRALETMQIVRSVLGLDPVDFKTDGRLMEINYGHWQGTLAADLPKFDPVGMKARARDHYHWRAQGGESYADMMARSVEWLEGIARDTVVVSHGGVSRVLRGYIFGLDNAAVTTLDMPHDRVLVLRHDGMDWL